MAEPFKNLLNISVIGQIGAQLRRVSPSFDTPGFFALAAERLETLELKDRARQIASALEATLPTDFVRAAEMLEATLGPPLSESDSVALPRDLDTGLAGWAVWPLTEFVARRGQQQPVRALQALHAMTQRFTAEWAVRGFIESHPELTYATLQRWSADPSAHVRRLVSEGSRPRLPWGQVLKSLVVNPAPSLPLLRSLQHDTSPYVRRSVANHLNDIARDNPAQLVAWLHEHLPTADAQLRSLLRHASRTSIKRGESGVLAAWGLGAPLRGVARLQLKPKTVHVGMPLRLSVAIESSASEVQNLVVDFRVHFVNARGTSSPKVFKGWQIQLAPHSTARLEKSHLVREISTRIYRPGIHGVDLLINGETAAESSFKLVIDIPRIPPGQSRP